MPVARVSPRARARPNDVVTAGGGLGGRSSLSRLDISGSNRSVFERCRPETYRSTQSSLGSERCGNGPCRPQLLANVARTPFKDVGPRQRGGPTDRSSVFQIDHFFTRLKNASTSGRGTSTPREGAKLLARCH